MTQPQPQPKLKRAPPADDADRPPSQNIDAERAVLGGIILTNKYLSTVRKKLEPDYFFHDAHRWIYICMLQLADARQPIDLITLGHQLRRQSRLEAVGGDPYLAELIDGRAESRLSKPLPIMLASSTGRCNTI